MMPSFDAKTIARLCLFSIALFLFFGSMQLLNILINLTVEGNAGAYFEFIDVSTDRILVYTLNVIALIYVSTRLARKFTFRLLLFLVLSTVVFAGYFAVTPIVDALLIVASFIALTWFLTGAEPLTGVSRRKGITDLIVYLVFILLAIELVSLICWFIFPVFPGLSQEGVFRRLVDVETKMFLLTGGFAPLLAVFFLFSWVAKPLARLKFWKQLRAFFAQGNDAGDIVHLAKPLFSPLLLLSIVFSFIVVLYPYLPGLNPDMHPIGADTLNYETFLLNMEKDGSPDILSYTFLKYPIRPLSLYAMYFVKYVSGLPALSVAQFFPLILAPALVLAVFFFAREAYGKNHLPALTAFLAFTSFHATVGLYGALLSNWMAIVESYFFMGFFFSFLKNKARWKVLVMLSLSVVMLFTHAAAWGMVMGILLVYLCFTVLKQVRAGFKTGQYIFEIRLLLIIISVNVAAVLLRNYALGWPFWQLETLTTAGGAVSAGAPIAFWDDTYYTFFHTMYSFFVNSPALLLAAFGGCLIVLDDKPVNRYLLSWLVASSIVFVLTSGWEVKSRILFNIPLPIFEAVGLIGVCRVIQKFFTPERSQIAKTLITLLVMLVGLNYVFRCVFVMSQVAF